MYTLRNVLSLLLSLLLIIIIISSSSSIMDGPLYFPLELETPCLNRKRQKCNDRYKLQKGLYQHFHRQAQVFSHFSCRKMCHKFSGSYQLREYFRHSNIFLGFILKHFPLDFEKQAFSFIRSKEPSNLFFLPEIRIDMFLL